MLRKALLIIFLFSVLKNYSQKKDSSNFSMAQAEWDLKALQKTLFFSKKENERFEANKEFLKLWLEVLANPKSLEYPFDSLKEISKITSRDKKFRIITWNVPRNDGTQSYFGFIQVNNKKIQKKGLFGKTITIQYEVFPLLDKSASVKSPENYVSDNTKWFGMLYYDEIIDCDGYYTLLGWDGNDNLTQKKFIDVLFFRTDGVPVFGKDVFKVPKRSPKRAVFEYSSEVAMSLKYNSKNNSIVFSHLAAKDEGSVLEGQYQYYGPDGSFDAYEQSKDRWVLREDIDARNLKNKNDNLKKPDPKKEKDLYKPKK